MNTEKTIEQVVADRMLAIEEQARLDVLAGLGQAVASIHKTGIDDLAYSDIRKKIQKLIIEVVKDFEEVK